MKKQVNEDLKEFLAKLEEVESPRMYKYYKSSTSDVLKLSDNKFIEFEKPHIKRSFCFGYGMYLQSSKEDEDRADAMANKASTDAKYFIEENMSELTNKIIKADAGLFKMRNPDTPVSPYLLKKYPNAFRIKYEADKYNFVKPYLFQTYYTKDFVANVRYLSDYELKEILGDKRQATYYIRPMEDEELEAYYYKLLSEKDKLMKRLQTYLKKYGLSKLHVWTYLVD